MRDATNITIHELIIHILDPQGQGLILSNVPVPLEQDAALVDYFTRHILTSLRDGGIKSARFRNINPEQPSGVCRGILRDEISLVDGSQRLARDLYAILERDRRITSGDLAVCTFAAGNYPDETFLGIMKVDPGQIFQHILRKDARGNTYVSFESVSQAFTSERLQKCAFVQPLVPRHPEFDMLLLDRQRREETAPAGLGAIARFFSETFLDAEESYDARKYTETVFRSLVEAGNLVREQLSEDENVSLEANILQAVSAPRLNLDQWLDKLPLADGIKQEIDQSISPRVPAREFPIDHAVSQQLVRKVRYRGEGGLKLEVPMENLYQLVVSEEYITDDADRPPYYRIVIETEEWKRIV
jgi:ATP-dependent exoDNAse (exonuclease V) alpha subunit